jgi:hypothetical protein
VFMDKLLDLSDVAGFNFGVHQAHSCANVGLCPRILEAPAGTGAFPFVGHFATGHEF